MYDLLIGGPGETRETARETIDFVKRIGPDCIGISLGVRIYDGTPLAADVRRQGPMEENAALHGATQGNPDFTRPMFFISPELGPDIEGMVRGLVGGDRRFFLPDPREEGNYNYNGNETLVRAIAAGERGAYWEILWRRAGTA